MIQEIASYTIKTLTIKRIKKMNDFITAWNNK